MSAGGSTIGRIGLLCRLAERRPARWRGGRRGFSLAEVVLGAAVLAMFMLATPLAIRMAGKAVPDGKSTASAALDAGRAVELFASDLAFATSIVAKSGNSLTFTVPDRNGDGLAETIQYSWTPPAAGQPAASLMRQYNGATATIAGNVQEFSLAYDTRTATTSTTTTGAEILVFSANTASGLTNNAISSNSWAGEFFQPLLPANAVSWNLTRAVLNIQQGQAVGQASVQIWKAAGQTPDAVVLDTSPQNASTSLSAVTAVSFPFSNLNSLAPSSNLYVVVTSADATAACNVQKCMSSAVGQGGLAAYSGGSGNWSHDGLHDLCLDVYGTVNTPGTPTTLYYLTDVRCTLRTNANVNSRVVSSIRLLNQPQVSGP